MRKLLALLIFTIPIFGQVSSSGGGNGGITLATFASPPVSPGTRAAFLFTDASATGVCSGGSTAYAICVWNGATYVAVTGSSTGLGDPASNSIPYRNGSGTTIPATATQLSGPNFCSDAGSTDTYACNLSPVISSYVAGTIYWFKANTVNTGAASINFNAKGALTIKKMAGAITTDLADNDIRVGQWVAVFYDGTNAQMVSQLGNAEVPLTFSAGVTRTANNIACDVATGSVPGCLAAADWTIFNNKQAALSGFTNTQFVYATGAGSLASHAGLLNGTAGDSPTLQNSLLGKLRLTHRGAGPQYNSLQFDDSANTNAQGSEVYFKSTYGNVMRFFDAVTGWNVTGLTLPLTGGNVGCTGGSTKLCGLGVNNTPTDPAETQTITLTTNVTSSTLDVTNGLGGQLVVYNICQNSTGGFTFVWPTNVKGGGTPGTAANLCSRQLFLFDGTNAIAIGPMSYLVAGITTTPEANLGVSDITTNNASTSAHGFVPKLPNDITQFYNGIGGFSAPAGGNASVPSVGNITAVTVAANTTSDQTLQEIALPAGFLNTLKQQTIFNSSGVFATGVAQTPTLTFSVKLCTVSGCGSGTTITLVNFTTGNTISGVTVNPWNITLTSGTSATGASGTLIIHGFLAVDIGALAATAETVYNDGRIGVTSAIDLTAALFVDWTVATSTGNTGNSFTQQNAGVMAPGGSPVSSVNAKTGAVVLALNSADFANQGTTTTILHGNASGNPSFGSVVNNDIAAGTIDLTTKVVGALPAANVAAIPISTGVSGLGSNVAAFLATPSGANFNAMITGGGVEVPQNAQSAAYTTVLGDCEHSVYHPVADTTARTWTIDSNANVAAPIGCTIMFVNDASAGVITIAITSDTLVLAGAGTTGSRTLAASGIAIATKMTSTRWMINGTGLN